MTVTRRFVARDEGVGPQPRGTDTTPAHSYSTNLLKVRECVSMLEEDFSKVSQENIWWPQLRIAGFVSIYKVHMVYIKSENL
jgi:hypothetical protein